jgi:alkanesulfonate monooxygenase SsuD/methylene tetrahydromethanopterin reductase-like flavin-dependent oxidoreductase (luciferase family)
VTAPRLGFLTHAASGASDREIVDDTIAVCVEAERLGYHSIWLAQHHFGAEGGVVPSPLVLLAAIAARTERIRLGTAVLTLALEDPIRAAEDAALVDLISGGRVELGLGSGAHPPTFTAMSRDFSRRADDSSVNAGVLASVLSGDALPGGAVLTPPSPSLGQRLWRATTTRKAAAAAAQLGQGVLLARSWPLEAQPVGRFQHPIALEYRQVAEVNGYPPRLGVSRTILPGPDATMLAHAAADARDWSRGEGLPSALNDGDDATVLERHSVIHGSAARITDALQSDPTVRLATDLLVQFQPTHLSLRDSLSALGSIAESVAAMGGGEM